MKDATNELQILVLVLDAAHMVSRGAQCGHLGVFRVVFVFVFVFLSSSSFCICQLCGSLMAGGNKSHVCQGKQKCLLSKLDICTAKFDIYVTSFVFSTLEH